MDNRGTTSPEVFAAMQSGVPLASYTKTILGKLYVNFLNPFTGSPEGRLLSGDPKTSDDAIIDLWTVAEDLYFKRMNKRAFETGLLIKKVRKPAEEKKTIEQFSDEELIEIINMKTISFQKQLSEITSEVVLTRLLGLSLIHI